MKEQAITNWLIFGVAVAWACKIGFHFLYLKASDNSVREPNFVSFYLKIENLLLNIRIILPIFLSGKVADNEKIRRMKWRAKVSTYVLWAMFGLAAIVLSRNTIS